jgi:hypothetical protein
MVAILAGFMGLLIIIAGAGLSVANYYYTYGLWPKSWLAFVLFTSFSVICHILTSVLNSRGKR